MQVEIQVTEDDLRQGDKYWQNTQKNALSIAINRVLSSGYRSSVGDDSFIIFYNSKEQQQYEVVVLEKSCKFTGTLPQEAQRIDRNLAFYPTLTFTGKFTLEIPRKFLK